MKLRGRFVGIALASMIGGAAACGGDGTGPGATAASVTGVAGDNQTGPTGTPLAFPLSFTALNSNGQPAQGVRVKWAVAPTGGATFSPAADTTDASGIISTTVTTTGIVGTLTLTATVPGVSGGVVYHATVLNPCAFLAPSPLGQTVNGVLRSTDCNFKNAGFLYDYYDLPLAAGQQSIRISMHGHFTTLQFPSDTEDTWLELFDVSGPLVAFDDDSILGQDGARNSQIDIIAPGAEFVIGASTYDAQVLGPYTLAATQRDAAMNGCRQVWVMRGVTISDSVTLADCSDSAATPHYYDVARIIADSGTVLQMAERSTSINPSLALYRLRVTQSGQYVRTLVASNDDSSATNTNAFVRFLVDTLDIYDVIIGTSSTAGAQTGTYTFSIDTTTTLSPRRTAPTGRAHPWWQPTPGELLLRSRGLRSRKLS